MQTQDIQPALEQMVRDLMDLGAVCPEASFSVNSASKHSIYLRVDSSSEPLFDGKDFKFLFADTPEEELQSMTRDERADTIRQHRLITEALDAFNRAMQSRKGGE